MNRDGDLVGRDSLFGFGIRVWLVGCEFLGLIEGGSLLFVIMRKALCTMGFLEHGFHLSLNFSLLIMRITIRLHIHRGSVG